MSILGANTLAIVLGFDWRKKVATRLLGRLNTGLGIVALIAVVVLFSTRRRTGRPHPHQVAPARTACLSKELMMTTRSKSIRPFRVAITDEDIADLHQRLARTRWPHPETVDDWSQGVRIQSAGIVSTARAAALSRRTVGF